MYRGACLTSITFPLWSNYSCLSKDFLLHLLKHMILVTERWVFLSYVIIAVIE